MQPNIEKEKLLSDLGLGVNITNLREKIDQACKRAKRDNQQIEIIGVTKMVDENLMAKSLDYGIENFGENKPQEIKRKYELFDNSTLKWHQIGHLQTNKVKMIIDKVCLIQSLDRISLAKEIEKRAALLERDINVLIQINIGAEMQKSGVSLEELPDLLTYLKQCPHIFVKGLMCIAPYNEDAEKTRVYFKKMKNIFDDLKSQSSPHLEMQILSMGMTHDFEVAVEEGATMLRIGSGIYGKRNY